LTPERLPQRDDSLKSGFSERVGVGRAAAEQAHAAYGGNSLPSISVISTFPASARRTVIPRLATTHGLNGIAWEGWAAPPRRGTCTGAARPFPACTARETRPARTVPELASSTLRAAVPPGAIGGFSGVRGFSDGVISHSRPVRRRSRLPCGRGSGRTAASASFPGSRARTAEIGPAGSQSRFMRCVRPASPGTRWRR
jgi:hypothetical protein